MEREALIMKKILMGTEGRPEDERALTALCETLGADHVRLRIVHVLTVPMTVPLDVSMPEAERRADGLLRRSREIPERFDVPVETAVSAVVRSGPPWWKKPVGPKRTPCVSGFAAGPPPWVTTWSAPP